MHDTFDGPDGKNRVMSTSGLILCAQSFSVSNPLIAACTQIEINIHLIIAIILSFDGGRLENLAQMMSIHSSTQDGGGRRYIARG